MTRAAHPASPRIRSALPRLSGIAAALLVAGLPATALAHGGAYRGPGLATPAPGTTGGGKGPTTGGGPGGVQTGGGAGPTTGGGAGLVMSRKTAAQDYTDWATWWEFNKHEYLNLRARLGGQQIQSQGPQGGGAVAAGVRPAFAELKGEPLAALIAALAKGDADLADSAVLALARITPASEAALVRAAIEAALERPETSVQQSALLALGVLGDPGAVPLLESIVADRPEGRAAMSRGPGGGEVPELQRALAAIALGLAGDANAADALLAQFDSAKEAKIDLRGGALLGISLLPDAAPRSVPVLLEALHDPRLNDVVAAQAPIALMRIGPEARSALPQLLKLLQGKKTGNHVRQSSAIALGRLTEPGEREVILALIDAAEGATDDGTANFAFIALGEIGARAAASPSADPELLADLQRRLMRQLDRPKRRSALPFAATACALFVRGLPPASPLRGPIVELLFNRWEEEKAPLQQAPLTIALGLVEANERAAPLTKALASQSNPELAGYLAEALGMMNAGGAAPTIKARLRETLDTGFRVQLATGLGLLGDPDVSGVLVKEFEKATTLFQVTAIARALGNVGDRRAIGPLVALINDKSRPSLARAFACVALGLVGEKTDRPWNSRLSIGANYLAAFSAQREVLDIL